jgi:hypothetical protein
LRPLSRLFPLFFALTCVAGAALAHRLTLNPAGQVLAYRLNPGESLRYRLSGKIHARLPLGGDEPADLNADVKIVYAATPTTRLADGTMDVDLQVESAELAIEKIPFPLELKQAQEILNQSITLTRTGEVKKTRSGAPLPFGVSVPGVDPKRLYALIFPVVFQTTPVQVGDKWSFKSELLGGEGTKPSFTATVLRLGEDVPADRAPGKAGPKPAALPGKPAAVTGQLRIREEFEMPVDQKVDVENKPVQDEKDIHRVKQGKIEGNGIFLFDRTRGRIIRGSVNIRAVVKDTLVAEPASEGEPKELLTNVDARVSVELLPARSGGAKTTQKAEAKP